MHTLDELPLGQSGRISHINTAGTFARRLSDLGIASGTKITALHKSISGDAIAYRIRGAVIALRRADAKSIGVQIL